MWSAQVGLFSLVKGRASRIDHVPNFGVIGELAVPLYRLYVGCSIFWRVVCRAYDFSIVEYGSVEFELLCLPCHLSETLLKIVLHFSFSHTGSIALGEASAIHRSHVSFGLC